MNSFGRIFRIEIFGESHGESVGVIIDGCPAGIELKEEDFTEDLLRRKSGGKGTSERHEKDIPHIKSGVYKNRTTGSPVMIEFINENKISEDYEQFKIVPRPGQTDFVSSVKYKGFNDHRGGGHFSARVTAPIVAAGVIAKKILKNIDFKTKIIEIGGSCDSQKVLDKAIKEGDSLGGVIECSVYNLPAGIGEPFFYSLESAIGHLVFSIPSVKAVEFGEGFGSAKMKGSEYNDVLIDISGRTISNNCGGITGGISNGNQIVFRTSFRPPSSIKKKQQSLNLKTGKPEDLTIIGRHDVCPVLRASVIVEAAAAVAICDLTLINRINSNKC